MTVDYRVGDTREVVATIPDGSVDLVASSPPFLALRSYLPAGHVSKGDEIGSEANPAAFIDMLLGLTAEWGRVLAAHGSIAIELGDTYSGSGGAGGDYGPSGLRDGQTPFDGSANRSPPSGAVGDRYAWPRAKSLALIPQLYAVAVAYGLNPLTGQPSPAGRWLVRNVIVWHRPNPAVGALGDKVRPSTSYIVIATRSPKRWFDLTAVRGAHKPNGGDTRGGISAVDGGTRMGQRFEHRTEDPAGAPPLDCWLDEYDGNHDTWTLTTQPSKLAHYAMWPAKLAERLILSMCPREVCRVCGVARSRIERTTNGVGQAFRSRANETWGRTDCVSSTHVPDFAEREQLGWTDCNGKHAPSPPPYYRPGLVLDPFAGSGTTLAVADLHGRDAIGADFDQRNHDIYPARHDEVKKALFGTLPEMVGQLGLAL